jgi:hypothetical protein
MTGSYAAHITGKKRRILLTPLIYKNGGGALRTIRDRVPSGAFQLGAEEMRLFLG